MLPDRSVLIGQKLVENAKIQMRHWVIFKQHYPQAFLVFRRSWLDVVLDHKFNAYPNVGCIVHYDNKCIQLYWNSIVIASSSLTKEQLHSTIESVLYMLSHHQKAKDTRPSGDSS